MTQRLKSIVWGGGTGSCKLGFVSQGCCTKLVGVGGKGRERGVDLFSSDPAVSSAAGGKEGVAWKEGQKCSGAKC